MFFFFNILWSLQLPWEWLRHNKTLRARERTNERFKSKSMVKVIGKKRVNKICPPFFKDKDFTWGTKKKKKIQKCVLPLFSCHKKAFAGFSGNKASAKTSINRCFLVEEGAVLGSAGRSVIARGTTLPVDPVNRWRANHSLRAILVWVKVSRLYLTCSLTHPCCLKPAKCKDRQTASLRHTSLLVLSKWICMTTT